MNRLSRLDSHRCPHHGSRVASLGRERGRRWWRRDDGVTTAEYAICTLAAVAFAGVLLKVLTSDTVRNALTSIMTRALQ